MMAGRYSLIDQTGLTEFLPLAQKKKMGVMLAGVFNSGILATGSIPGAKFDYTVAPDAIVAKVKKIEEVCRAAQDRRFARPRSSSRWRIPPSSRSSWAP